MPQRPTDRHAQHSSEHLPAHVQLQRKYGQARAGITITEYVLIGVGVQMIAIGALNLLSNNLNNSFKNMLGSLSNPAQITASAPLLQTGLPGGAASSKSSSSSNATNNTARAIETGTMEAASQEAVTLTTGVNGTTESSVQAMIDIAQKELASGKIDQSQYDLIMRLANKGHEIAVLEGVLDNAYTTNNTNGQIMYNGKAYSMTELNALFSQTVDDYKPLESAVTRLHIGPIISASASISYLAGSISQTGDGSVVQAAKLSSTNASGETHQQAAKICTAGQHTDVNNQCVK
jgi:hypothetical protein